MSRKKCIKKGVAKGVAKKGKKCTKKRKKGKMPVWSEATLSVLSPPKNILIPNGPKMTIKSWMQ